MATHQPVVTLRAEPSRFKHYLILLAPSLVGSIVVHAVLFGVFFLFMLPAAQAQKDEDAAPELNRVQADEPQEKITFNAVDVGPAGPEPATDINFPIDRQAEISIPGSLLPSEAVGFKDALQKDDPVSKPAAGGFGSDGQGGALKFLGPDGNSTYAGEAGGIGPRGLPLNANFAGRSGATREWALRSGQGAKDSEAAVARGLKWLALQQLPDGRWMLNSPNLPEKDRGTETNDIAATALGLLPLLAAGHTHRPDKDNPYDKVIDKGLKFLMRSQNQKTGYFGVSMYAHGLATIAMCEAYGLSQDPVLRRPAQAAINLIVNTQHEGGGWRYGPEKKAGDLSITGWQIMALKSAQMAGLDVPSVVSSRAKMFLQSCANATDEGYAYVPGTGSTPRMTAVGLLCRQYMENWGPSHPRMIKAVSGIIKNNPPNRQDVYYYYYATQVMHHFGGEAWRDWNGKMRDYLIKTQDGNSKSAHFGSWSVAGDQWGRHGGRLMMTSLNLLTLEVYYRYLPLYYRDAGAKMDKAVQAAQ